jgi:hypothetical protein
MSKSRTDPFPAQGPIQLALDNNEAPSWSGTLFDDMSNSKTVIGVSCNNCNLLRDFICAYNGNAADNNPAKGTIYLCNKFWSLPPCEQAETLAVEISKLDNGVTAPSGEEGKFAGWLHRRLCQ